MHDIICFDVDSTLVRCEGLDWLAQQKGVGQRVKELTELSMNGTILMEEVFTKKLDILRPSKSEMEQVGEHYCQSLTEDADTVIKALQGLNKEVWLITGSFTPAIEILANRLNIPSANILTNTIFFNDDGNYLGIDGGGHLTKADGKSIHVKNIGKGKIVAFVGDSVTDLATKDFVETFIGYGGVTVRKKVKSDAHYFIQTRSLAPLLLYILSDDEIVELKAGQFKHLLDKAYNVTSEAL